MVPVKRPPLVRRALVLLPLISCLASASSLLRAGSERRAKTLIRGDRTCCPDTRLACQASAAPHITVGDSPVTYESVVVPIVSVSNYCLGL